MKTVDYLQQHYVDSITISEMHNVLQLTVLPSPAEFLGELRNIESNCRVSQKKKRKATVTFFISIGHSMCMTATTTKTPTPEFYKINI